MKKWLITISIVALLISFVSLVLQIKTAEKEGVFDTEKTTETIEVVKNTE